MGICSWQWMNLLFANFAFSQNPLYWTFNLISRGVYFPLPSRNLRNFIIEFCSLFAFLILSQAITVNIPITFWYFHFRNQWNNQHKWLASHKKIKESIHKFPENWCLIFKLNNHLFSHILKVDETLAFVCESVCIIIYVYRGIFVNTLIASFYGILVDQLISLLLIIWLISRF